MPQQTTPHRPKATTTKVQNALKDECFRQSVEVSWQRNRAETDGLEVLARCKALNEFIKKGLLAEVEDDTKGQAKHRSTHKQQGVNQAAANSAAAGSLKSPSPSSSTPLTSRLTAKESEAILHLLLIQDNEDSAEAAAAAPGTTLMPSSNHHQQPVGPTNSDVCCSSSNSDSSGQGEVGLNHCPAWGSAAQASTAPQQPAQAASIDMLDDVIGLLNAPGDSCTPYDAACSPCDQQQQQQQQHQQARESPLPTAACCEVHRQAYVRPPEKQQEGLRAVASKHANISAAWQGFYSYWGPHAASTIQHYWRAHRMRQQYQQLRQAALVLQACSRGHLLRASQRNLLRLHREQLQQQQQQQQVLQQQQLLFEQQQQQALELKLQLQLQKQAAAVALQSAIRGWLTRQKRMALAAAAAAADAAVMLAAALPAAQQAATAAADVMCAGDSTAREAAIVVAAPSASSRASSVCSRDSDSSSSRGSSRQSHSRGSTVHSCDTQAAAAAGHDARTTRALLLAAEGHDVEQQQQLARSKEHQSTCSDAADDSQYLLPGLVVRSAADMRTASHGGAEQPGSNCQHELARTLVHRAGQLGVHEGVCAADLAARTVMTSSSFRQIQSVMGVVKAARLTL